MKVGIIRCMQTEDFCPGTTDFRMIREKKGAFEGVEEDIEIIGFINCGGCPGKKAVLRARDLMVRECVERKHLMKPMTVKLLDASREYWKRNGVTDWGLVINAEK